jgi:hypothetical protein
LSDEVFEEESIEDTSSFSGVLAVSLGTELSLFSGIKEGVEELPSGVLLQPIQLRQRAKAKAQTNIFLEIAKIRIFIKLSPLWLSLHIKNSTILGSLQGKSQKKNIKKHQP